MNSQPAATRVIRLFMVLGIAFGAGHAAAQPPALTYQSQRTSDPVAPTFIHSGITTVVRGQVIWDVHLARMAAGALRTAQGGNNYNEVAFAFLQCNGGGMIDELLAQGYTNASYTSAARHNESSVAWPQPKFPESTYGLPYAPKAGSAMPQSQKDAATFARANDIAGPFSNLVLKAPNGQVFKTDPQYTSAGAVGDAIKLHRNGGVNPTNNTAYKAILWGGANWNANDVLTNGRTSARMATNMAASGYVAADVRTIGGVGATFASMAKAWNDLKAVLNNTTQVFFWSSWGHGTPWLDQVGKRKFQNANQAPKRGLSFNTDLVDTPESSDFFQQFQDVYDFWQEKGDTDLLPYFHIVSPEELIDPTVQLNSYDLPLFQSSVLDIFDDGSELEYAYSFAIDSLAYDSIVSSGGTDVIIDFFDPGGVLGDDLDFLRAGLTAGDAANGPAWIPEPGTIALVSIGLAICLGRRRRSRRNPSGKFR